MNLILASASPRRQEILSFLGIPFQVIPAQIEENVLVAEDALRAARDKALWVAERNPDSLVLGADTVVVTEEEVLGKPSDLTAAARMLQKISGKTHRVVTGVYLAGKNFKSEALIQTEITVNSLSNQEIQQYLSEESVLDAAGAYKIQGCFSRFVPKIQGDYLNVVGLPLFWVYEQLKKIKFEK